VLEKLREWQATIKGSQLLGKNPLDSFELNFLFTGSPGTVSVFCCQLSRNDTITNVTVSSVYERDECMSVRAYVG
jgi:hypothetical protein